jgi:hypothetical protein
MTNTPFVSAYLTVYPNVSAPFKNNSSIAFT